MSAVDFSEWAVPDLVFTNLGADSEGLGGHTFSVRPPSVDDMTKVLALAVRAEVSLGLVSGVEIPEAVTEVLASIGPKDHPALGETFQQMRAAGISSGTIDRAATYAIFYWARGRAYAEAFATVLWAPRTAQTESAAEGDATRKG